MYPLWTFLHGFLLVAGTGALATQLLGWHLFLVPPTSRAAVLGTGLAYAAVLVLSVPLLRPRGPRPAPSTVLLFRAGDAAVRVDRPG